MKRTPLYKIHQGLGAKLIDFGGWEMPVQYTSIIEEHEAVRNACGLFDVSHMGEFFIKGRDALKNLQYLVTNNVNRLEPGQVLYTPMCYPDGGIVDDLLIYCFDKTAYMMVVNASNTIKDYEWVGSHISGDIIFKNVSANYALLAIQGPESKKVIDTLTPLNLDELDYYRFKKGVMNKYDVILSRTGYTGELGYEIYLPQEYAVDLWNKLMDCGKKYNLLPAGLGARNTLRLEKKYCLYGNDIDKNRHPLEAGLAWTVQFNKDDFIGKKALLQYKEKGYPDRLIGFKLTGRGIPRHGYKIRRGNNIIGIVTSGSYSPTLKENIGLGYIKKEYSSVRQEIEVLIRNKPVSGIIVKTPFV